MSSSTQDERWKQLCQAIVEECDSNRLMELVNQLNRVLEEKEKSDGQGHSRNRPTSK